MNRATDTALNSKQHAKLDRMAQAHSRARVVRWSEQYGGPVVREPDGTEFALPPTGYQRKIRSA